MLLFNKTSYHNSSIATYDIFLDLEDFFSHPIVAKCGQMLLGEKGTTDTVTFLQPFTDFQRFR